MGSVPTIRTQVFYNYDKAVVDFFHDHVKQLNYVTGHRSVIPCVFATPQRAFAQVARQIARKRGAAQVTDADIKNVPLPFMSLSRVDEKYDPTRYVRYNFSPALYEPATGNHYGTRSPAPYDFTYQLEVWSRTIDEMDDASNQIRQQLRADEMWLTVNHPPPYGDISVLSLFQGQIEHSEMDPRSKDERVVRRSYTFVLKGWVCYEMTVSSIVERVIVDFYGDVEGSDHLDQVVVSQGDQPEQEEEASPETNNEQRMNTTIFCGLIVGEALVGETYGGFTVPAPMTINGLQAHVGGRAPSGDALELQLVLNGTTMPTYKVRVSDGSSKAAAIFGSPISVVAGDVVKVICTNVGSTDPGDWVEVQVDVTVRITY